MGTGKAEEDGSGDSGARRWRWWPSLGFWPQQRLPLERRGDAGGGGKEQGRRRGWQRRQGTGTEVHGDGGGGIQIWQPFGVKMNRAKNLVRGWGLSCYIRVVYRSGHITLPATASFTAAGNLTHPL
jgi:hypothetical protein